MSNAGPLRSRPALAVLLVVASIVIAAASNEPVVLLTERDRRELTPVSRGGVDMLPLGALLGPLGLASAPDPRGTSLTLSYQGREVTVYDGKSLASVGGDLRLLSGPVAADGGRWLVPIDSLPRLLGPLLDRRAEWRAASRLLVVGNVSAPRVTASTFVSGDSVRVVLEASEKVPFRVSQEEGRVTVSIPRDLIDVGYHQERLTGGIVDTVQFVGGRENVFSISLGRRFYQLKSAEEEGPPARLILDFQAEPLAAEKTATPVAPPAPAAGQSGVVRTVVIDPGHGGPEVGAKGAAGTLEKDVTLAIARKLRSAIVNGLGLQAFLTRDRDHEVALDDRTAFANNYKADLFISIHANASRAAGARGSEVYFLAYQATDEESRRLAALEGEAVPLSVPAGSQEVALILWDMAQAEHLEDSSALASRIQEELAQVTGSQGRGIKQAPFRVLVGATMPAVLVEVAFISNAEEERLLASEDYQNKIVSALARGVARYQEQRRRSGSASAPAPSGR